MERENQDSTPFSYTILDDEAAKISALILAVQQKCLQKSSEVARELFAWAEALREDGRRAEAEFLYLHCINMCERQHGAQYPIEFRSLRDFAATLVDRCCPQTVDEFRAAA